MAPYDAVLLMSFGGPEQPDDVVPFLQNVTRGRGIPKERLREVGQHYFLFGGRSPINDQNRLLLAALENELGHRGHQVPLYWANRNWDPYLPDTLRAIAAAGHRRVLALTTSAYPSYSSCRQYRENYWDAVRELELADGLSIDRIRNYANHPGYVAASVDATLQALASLGDAAAGARLLFVTHSIPTSMADTAGPSADAQEPAEGYVGWHDQVAAEVARQVAERCGRAYGFEVVYCSRSGPPGQPWLEPDVNRRLTDLAAAGGVTAGGVGAVVLVPIGFVSDHMEVLYDLDTEARATAEELGLAFARAATAGVHPSFVGALVELLEERAAVARSEPVSPSTIAGSLPGRYVCPADCCINLRNPTRGALCGAG